MEAAKDAIKESMEQIAQDVAMKEIVVFSENHLVARLKVVLPNVFESLGYAKPSDVMGVSLQCEDLAKD